MDPTLPETQLHVRVPRLLVVKLDEIRSHMRPKPSRSALIWHVLELYADGKLKEVLSDD